MKITHTKYDLAVPTDYISPAWHETQKVHDWKNYVSRDVQDIWQFLDRPQKIALAANFQQMADGEEWD